MLLKRKIFHRSSIEKHYYSKGLTKDDLLFRSRLSLFKTDIIEINHIMRDIGAIVSEQSPIIADVERNVNAANDNIIAGNNQLTSASRHQVN